MSSIKINKSKSETNSVSTERKSSKRDKSSQVTFDVKRSVRNQDLLFKDGNLPEDVFRVLGTILKSSNTRGGSKKGGNMKDKQSVHEDANAMTMAVKHMESVITFNDHMNVEKLKHDRRFKEKIIKFIFCAMITTLIYISYRNLLNTVEKGNDELKDDIMYTEYILMHIVDSAMPCIRTITSSPVFKPIFNFSIEALILGVLKINNLFSGSWNVNQFANPREYKLIACYVIGVLFLQQIPENLTPSKMSTFMSVRESLNNVLNEQTLDGWMNTIFYYTTRGYSAIQHTNSVSGHLGMIEHTILSEIRTRLTSIATFLSWILVFCCGPVMLHQVRYLMFNWHFDMDKRTKEEKKLLNSVSNIHDGLFDKDDINTKLLQYKPQ